MKKIIFFDDVMKKRIGVYWGRFNPPHKGHLSVVKMLSKKVDRLIVVIGSSEHKNEKRNPFSGLERKMMLTAYLNELGIKNVSVVTQNDGTGYLWALDTLVKNCKPNILFLIGNEKPDLLKLARAELKGRVEVVNFDRTGTRSATKLREAIAFDKKWVHLTGKSVVKLIKKFNGIERIKMSYKKG